MLFRDRADAGRQLADRARTVAGDDVVVLGLPRGGVPVAFEVAAALGAPLDVIVVRKLGVPYQPELAMGAVGEGGIRVLNDGVIRGARVSGEDLAAVERHERAEVERRARLLRGDRPPADLAGCTVLVVDDGIATGSTVRVACRVARALGAGRVVLAVPVAPADVLEQLRADADEIVCVHVLGDRFGAVGQAYADFAQVADREVVALLDRAARRAGLPAMRAGADRLPGEADL